MTLFEGNLPQKRQREREREREREKERKREREKERKRERERAECQMDVVIAGTSNRAPQVEFPSSVLPVL